MTKCVTSLKVSDDFLHIQCWDHKLNLVQNYWSAELPEQNECVAKAKAVFLNTRKRKHNYLAFLNEKYSKGEKSAKLFPNPVLTRWNSWFCSVVYLCDYLVDLVEYFSTLEEVTTALKYFQDMSNDKVTLMLIECQATFLIEHCSELVELITVLEGSTYAFKHKLYGKVTELKSNFKLISDMNYGEKTQEKLKILPTLKQANVKSQFQSLGRQCLIKLNSLHQSDPSKTFFENIGTLFDIRSIGTKQVNSDLFQSCSEINFQRGYCALQTQVRALQINSKKVDILDISFGLKEDHQEFAINSIKAIWIPVSNVDSKRAYSNIMSDKHTNMKIENLETMLSLYFGD